MLDAVGFLDSFVEDEVKCRMVSEMDFGQPIANEENDVPYMTTRTEDCHYVKREWKERI